MVKYVYFANALIQYKRSLFRIKCVYKTESTCYNFVISSGFLSSYHHEGDSMCDRDFGLGDADRIKNRSRQGMNSKYCSCFLFEDWSNYWHYNIVLYHMHYSLAYIKLSNIMYLRKVVSTYTSRVCVMVEIISVIILSWCVAVKPLW